MFIDVVLALGLTMRHVPHVQADDLIRVQAESAIRAGTVVRYGPDAELRQISRQTLSPEMQQVFDTEFATSPYFGAFAVSKDGSWGYSAGTNALAAAREIAMQQCIAEGARCVIHTELVPQGYVDPAPGEVTLGPDALALYGDTESNAPFSAMAVSADGSYSKVWGYASPEEAETDALTDCENNRISGVPLSDMPCVLLPRPGKR